MVLVLLVLGGLLGLGLAALAAPPLESDWWQEPVLEPEPEREPVEEPELPVDNHT